MTRPPRVDGNVSPLSNERTSNINLALTMCNFNIIFDLVFLDFTEAEELKPYNDRKASCKYNNKRTRARQINDVSERSRSQKFWTKIAKVQPPFGGFITPTLS